MSKKRKLSEAPTKVVKVKTENGVSEVQVFDGSKKSKTDNPIWIAESDSEDDIQIDKIIGPGPSGLQKKKKDDQKETKKSEKKDSDKE